ncbi:hypothetical protein HZS_4656 [Henneguya salminicola]|nr:hypothetical protein HZS_4656 [Henneguya salminicola]
MKGLPATDIVALYVFKWTDEKITRADFDIKNRARLDSLLITFDNEIITANPFHADFLFMAVRIKKGRKLYLRTYPLYIFDMVDRLKTMSGYNMLKPKYTTISSPLEIEFKDLSLSEEKMVIEMFRLAHNTITSNKNLENIKNIVTKKLVKDNLELILFISSSDTIPFWSVALKFDNKDRTKPKVLYVMILDKADVTDDVETSIKKHFSDIILFPIAVSNSPALQSENFSPQTDPLALLSSPSAPTTEYSEVKGGPSLPLLSPTAPTKEDPEVKGGHLFPLPSPTAFTTEDSEVKGSPSLPLLSPTAPITEDPEVKGGHLFPLLSPSAPTTEDSEVKGGPSLPLLSPSAPTTEDSEVKGGPSLPLLSPTAPTTEDSEVKGGPSLPLPSPTAPTTEDPEVKGGPTAPTTNSSTVPTPSPHNEEDSKKTMIIIIVAVISALVLIGIIGFVSYYCLKIQGANKLKKGLIY